MSKRRKVQPRFKKTLQIEGQDVTAFGYHRLTVDAIRDSIRRSAEARGCTCDFEYEMPEIVKGQINIGKIFHDDWCPALES